MTDEPLRPEDFEPHRVEPERKAVKGGFSEVWREQPLIRLGVILLPVIAVVLLVIGVFGGSKTQLVPSKVTAGSGITVGGESSGAVSKSYETAVKDVNEQRKNDAITNGTSTIPTNINPVSSAGSGKADVMEQFTAQTPPPPVTAPPAPVQPASPLSPAGFTPPPAAAPHVDPQQIQAMAAEMRSIMGAVQVKTPTLIRGTTPQPDKDVGTQTQSAAPARKGKILVPAATVLYGQTLTEADSDIPAPILVSMLSGPFAGGRAIGTFQKTEDYLILAFGTIIKNKKEYKVNALAIDPETTLLGLETSTDHHYFERFILPAAAGFISGVGNYAQQAGSTVTNSTYGVTQSYPPLNTHQEILSGLGQSANALAGAINKESNEQPTIYVDSGTGIGIMFLNTVREIPDDR